MNVIKSVVLVALCSIAIPVFAAKGGNKPPEGPSLEEQVATLTSTVDALEGTVASQAAIITQLQSDISNIYGQLNNGGVAISSIESRLDTAEGKIATLETSGGGLPPEVASIFNHLALDEDTSTIVFSGVNVQIVNGLGDTSSINGLGNLSIGYNENHTGVLRGGSHNLVLGVSNGYSGTGSLVVGSNNQISANNSAIVGGTNNLVTGDFSVIAGGDSNVAEGQTSTLLGGTHNRASNFDDVVVGGSANHANGNGYGTQIFGGGGNETGSGTIFGGANNKTFDGEPHCENPVIIGGDGNTNSGMRAVVVGGASQNIDCNNGASYSTVTVGPSPQ